MRNHATTNQNLALALGGIACAIFVAAVMSLPPKFAIATFVGVSLLSIPVFFKVNLRRFLVCVLVLHLPLRHFIKSFLDRDYLDSFVLRVGLGSIDFLLVIILYALWLRDIYVTRESKSPTLSRLDLWILGYLGVNILSLMNASDLSISILGIGDLIKVLLFYFYLSRNIRREDLKYILICLAFNLVEQFVITTLQYHKGTLLGIAMGMEATDDYKFFTMGFEDNIRADGTLAIPHTLACFLGFFLPLFLSLFFSTSLSPMLRGASLIVFLMGSLTSLLTFARGGWVSLIISCLLVILAHLSLGRWKPLGLLLVLFFLVTPFIIISYQEDIYARLNAPDELITARFDAIKESLSDIGKNPLLGMGIRNYGDDKKEKEEGLYTEKLPVHVIYLYIACEIGIIGLIFFIGILVAVFVRGSRFWFHSHDWFVRDMVIGLLGGMTGFVIQGFSDHTSVMLLVHVFWFTVGFLESLYRLKPKLEGRV